MDTWVSSFADFLQFERRYSPHTCSAYSKDITDFLKWLENQKCEDIIKATSQDIRLYLLELTEAKLAARSINRKLAALRTFYSYLVRNGSAEKNPASLVRTQKTPKRIPAFVQAKDCDFTLSEASGPGISDRAASKGMDTFASLRNRLVCELLYTTGMRLAELISLKRSEVLSAESALRITGKRSKTRLVPVLPNIKDILMEYDAERLKVFGTPAADAALIVTDKNEKAYPMLIRRIVHAALSDAVNLQKRSPHILRHTFATHLLDAGAELNAIKDLMGHANLAATQVYTHTSTERLKRAYAGAHPKGNKNTES